MTRTAPMIIPLPVLDTRPKHQHGLDPGPRSIAAVRVLRLSVTDRCNLRCVYCMPPEGVPWLPPDNILSFEEIAEVVQAAVEHHGIRRFKLTGGEPTVRRGIVDLVRLLRRVEGIEELSLTTNGMLLEHLAGPLKNAGLDRVTVSLDSLRPVRFRRVTRNGDLATVLRGLDRIEEVGFQGIKINCVVMRGTNDDELADFARLTLNRRLTVRFIEYMPIGYSALVDSPRAAGESGPAAGCGSQDRGGAGGQAAFMPESQVRAAIERELGPLVPVHRSSETGVGPAVPYRLARGDAPGRIGFISAMSAPFCSTCNRLRLTADGILRSCLFDGGEMDLKPILRQNTRLAGRRYAVAQAMIACAQMKPELHGAHGNGGMNRIGG